MQGQCGGQVTALPLSTLCLRGVNGWVGQEGFVMGSWPAEGRQAELCGFRQTEAAVTCEHAASSQLLHAKQHRCQQAPHSRCPA